MSEWNSHWGHGTGIPIGRLADGFGAAARGRPGRADGRAGWVGRRVLLMVVSASAAAGCGVDFWNRFSRVFQEQVIIAGAEGECGPIEIGILVPDCPVRGACFSSACAAHNECYGTCGMSRQACDEQFFRDLIGVCSSGFAITDPQYLNCRYFALFYWAAVLQYGEDPYRVTQEGACGSPPPPEPPGGSCCGPGTPPTCRGDLAFVDCPAANVFIPQFTCEEIDILLGGCPVPGNDECAGRLAVCAEAAPTPGLGQCAGDSETQRGGGVCDLAAQDCPNGMACAPTAGEVIRCRVAADNRLATTDGPEAGGACAESGVDSFQADVWFEYVAPCSGTLTVRMCEEITYDSMVTVYGTHVPGEACACPTDNANLLECNDDYCSFAQSTSGITLERAVAGACYLIRVGGWSSDGTFEGAARARSTLDIGLFCDEEQATNEARGK